MVADMGALEGREEKFNEVARKYSLELFRPQRHVVPWYTLRKTRPGLRDATASPATARRSSWNQICRLGRRILSSSMKPRLEDAQHRVRRHEQVLATSMPTLVTTAGNFPPFRSPCRDRSARRADRLAGLHGNAQVPKLLGIADAVHLRRR